MLTRKGKISMQDACTQTDAISGIYIINPWNVNISPNPLELDNQPKQIEYSTEDSYKEDDTYDDEDDTYDDEDDTYDDGENNKKRKRDREIENCGYTGNDLDYFRTLTKKERTLILKEEERIQTINYQMVPLRFMILDSKMDDKLKAYAINKLDSLGRMDPSSGEYNKMMNFLEAVSKIPVGVYKKLACTNNSSVEDISTFLNSTRDKLNNTVFGHNDCKDQIIRLLAQWISNPQSNGLVIGIEGPMGCGKCHGKNTPIMMYDGSVKMVQDIKVGEIIMGDDSTPRNVLALGRGKDYMYDVIYTNDKTIYTVNSEHILCLYQYKRGILGYDDTIGWVVNDYDFKKMCNISFNFREKKSAIRYLRSLKPRFIELCTIDYISLPDVVKNSLRGYKTSVIYNNCKTIIDAYAIGYNSSPLTLEMKTASIIARQDILAGIIDRRGIVLGNKYNIITYSIDHVNDILYLARSLGLAAYVKEQKITTRFSKKNIKDDNKTYYSFTGLHYKVIVYGKGIENLPVKSIARIPSACQDIVTMNVDSRDIVLYNILVKPNQHVLDSYYGFTLDGNHKYILGDFAVTHNTTLVKEGICKALGLPFGFIPLGGISDGSYLVGHSYTYEGSKWGRILEILMNCGCMNPILFFDELDKVSNTRYGEEIKNILIHLTDASQNTNFHDKYFSDLALDLSKCLVIFSYNDGDLINPILKDRMVTIKTHGYNMDNKVEIVNEYMLHELFEKFGFKTGEIVFTQDIIKSIIRKTAEEKGVRNLKRSLESIISEINLARLLKKGLLLEEDPLKFPYTVKAADIEKLLKVERVNDSLPLMYC